MEFENESAVQMVGFVKKRGGSFAKARSIGFPSCFMIKFLEGNGDVPLVFRHRFVHFAFKETLHEGDMTVTEGEMRSQSARKSGFPPGRSCPSLVGFRERVALP